MTFEQPKIKQKDPELESFHCEIQKLKEKEEKEFKEKGEGSIHFRGLNPEELTIEDKVIFEKFKNLELSEEEFYEWRRKINQEAEAKVATDSSLQKNEVLWKDSRHSFMQFIANKIGFWQFWEKKRKEFELFRQEIKRRKEEEIQKMENKENYDPHLVSINPQKLTPVDMEFFKKLQDDSLKDSSEEFRCYRSEIFQDCQEHFRQEAQKHKKLGEITAKSGLENERSAEYDEALQRFLAIFSRSNFLAWIQNELINRAYDKKKKQKK